ncbi:MAG: cobalamin-independent methionine synthase II family protein [Hyphomicrobiaceae bacterium]
MKRSTDRILTTHVGSLIRPSELQQQIRARQSGKGFDQAEFDRVLARSVADIVASQVKAGVDVVSDGEFGKFISWSQYVLDRFSGFERRPFSATGNPWARGADRTRFKEFYAELDAQDAPATQSRAVCVGPVAYTGDEAVGRDIANFKAALAATPAVDAFMPVAAPASVVPDRENEYYKSEDELLDAIGLAMRHEYKTIVDAGFLVQLDDARTAVTFDRMVPPASFEDFRRWAGKLAAVLNHAVEGIPEDKIRYHVCWGSWPGPHTTDVPLKDIADIILSVKAGAYVIEGANPRHDHEWKVWKDVKLPDGKVIVPGVISHATNVVEHPELVADRIVRLAEVVGRENVIAGTDCGFAQSPFYRRVHPSIMWAKLEALAEGARLASGRLWKR